MSKVDYGFKARILNEHNDICIRERKARYNDYCRNDFLINGVIHKNIGNESYFDFLIDCYDKGLSQIAREAFKINMAFGRRQARLKEKVIEITKQPCLFLTITFTNDYLETTTREKRRKDVVRFLKNNSKQYIANIDFGKENGREHYHAIIQSSHIEPNTWSNGALNFEKIRMPNSLNESNKTNTRVAKYLNKLTNHAIKATTQRTAIIYSR